MPGSGVGAIVAPGLAGPATPQQAWAICGFVLAAVICVFSVGCWALGTSVRAFCSSEVALAGLLGRVGGGREALVALGLAWVRDRHELPGGRLLA